MFDMVTPMTKIGELFLLKRDMVSIEIKSAGLPPLKTKQAMMYLTTSRVVLVPKKPVMMKDGFQFTSFELPLPGLANEKFNQPIFGANYLSGTVPPAPGMGLESEATFKITFHKGGAGTFLRLFFRAIVDTRNPQGQNLSMEIQSGNLEALAVTDPSDPSVVYLQQPNIPTAVLMTDDNKDDKKGEAAQAKSF